MGNGGSRLRFWRRDRQTGRRRSSGHGIVLPGESDKSNCQHYPRPQVPDPYADDEGGSLFPNDAQGDRGFVLLPAIPFRKAVVIQNNVNIKKESLCLEPDEENPGKFLVSLTLDANAEGSFSIIFFAKEGPDGEVAAMKETIQPVSISFQEGLGQKFRQPCGTGIDFSMFKEIELTASGDDHVYPLAIRAEAYRSRGIANQNRKVQITFAMFEKKEMGFYQVCPKEQIFWVDSYRYELQDVYGVEGDADGHGEGNETAKECIICFSKSRNTIMLPCRHLCLCSKCGKKMIFKSSQCPVCRKPVELFLRTDSPGEV